MCRRIFVVLIALVLALCPCMTAFACDEDQTEVYVTQILFGDDAASKASNEQVRMLTSALYLCSEQSDGLGQDKVDFLKARVRGIPSLDRLDIKGSALAGCSHVAWDSTSDTCAKEQASRRKVLLDTTGKVFDFGTFDSWFTGGNSKRNSLAALLYYTHILADHIADQPSETEVNIGGRLTDSYSGSPFVEVNGNKPGFSKIERMCRDSFIEYSELDGYGRAGMAFGCIGPDTITGVPSRENIGMIKPSGWNSKRYEGIVDSPSHYAYDRCHLIAHMLGGADREINLVTGTRYMNVNGMLHFENQVSGYIKTTGNHVLYRATPIFKGNNALASGVQLEAYSVEDEGKGLQFNVFCYNVQPGLHLNYANGDSEIANQMVEDDNVLPFATQNPSDTNPDLIFEIDKHLSVLFEDQTSSETYCTMANEIKTIAYAARSIGDNYKDGSKSRIEMVGYQYEYLDVLKTYVPKLLAKEEYFTSAFKG